MVLVRARGIGGGTMTINVAGSGEACCGNCGHELEIVCTGGCPEPDIVFRENSVATMAKPGVHFGKTGPQKRTPIRLQGFCAWPAGCDLPVAPWIGRGRVPIMCPGHMGPSRAKVPA